MLRRITNEFTLGVFGVGLLFLSVFGSIHADEPTTELARVDSAVIFAPVYGPNGLALVVAPAGATVAQFDESLFTSRARGAWAQTATGEYVLYIAGGPTFVNQSFIDAFPNGWNVATSMMFIR